jgi:hypothetical protein
MIGAQAHPDAGQPRVSFGSLTDAPTQTWWTDFDWSTVPAWGGDVAYVGGPGGVAGIIENGVYLMTVGIGYHLSIPVPGDFTIEAGVQLRGAAGSTTQVIGFPPGVSTKVTAPPETTRASRFETDVSIFIPSVIVALGQQWYGETIDLNCPVGLASMVTLNYDYDTVRPLFVYGDADEIVTHDGFAYWSVAPIKELVGGGGAGSLSAGQVRTGARDSVKMRGGSVKQLEVEAVDHGPGGTT